VYFFALFWCIIPQLHHSISPPPHQKKHSARSQRWTLLRQGSTSQSGERVQWLVEWQNQWRPEMHAVLTMRSVVISCRKMWTGERFVSHPVIRLFDIRYSTKHINSVKMKLNLNYAVGPYFDNDELSLLACTPLRTWVFGYMGCVTRIDEPTGSGIRYVM
jgi:hypothetical protein